MNAGIPGWSLLNTHLSQTGRGHSTYTNIVWQCEMSNGPSGIRSLVSVMYHTSKEVPGTFLLLRNYLGPLICLLVTAVYSIDVCCIGETMLEEVCYLSICSRALQDNCPAYNDKVWNLCLIHYLKVCIPQLLDVKLSSCSEILLRACRIVWH